MAVEVAIYEGKGKGEFGELLRVEINGELVLTTAQIANFYGCTSTRISQNFLTHKEKFIAGKHYFELKGEDLKNFKRCFGKNESPQSQLGKNESPFVSQFTSILYLWTKRGVARHAKMLNTQMAWEVFELLEDNYFSDKKVSVKQPEGKIPKNELTDEKKIKFLLQAAKITKDAVTRGNLISMATALINGNK